ncbi:hypothetical protein TBLA_0A00750 [Henningerozyma blattae CBS 6284]|uniref:Uncharacterized protein n=1 Tax=Henningerozyma blattae (strain ATCC 34711 / CBS 6284 / DSM 70876 / NBRC 10599 / NRRL Y-10934 / UCD 77-7) TaxID=1071380 RepID=I2GUS4_HENB6|nr:hypothetical protein TBLA_0A00750 [Tetrapisispora blattae CBS 6284]CCH57876.1 hypothetical protein TBLA_0A00750 [Tetrapisispora blattae CBS 6284]
MNLKLNLIKRHNSTDIKTLKNKRVEEKDRLIKPIVVFVIFVGALSSVTNEKKKYQDLLRRYELKISILEQLINKAKRNDFQFNIDEEMISVNRLFRNSEISNNKLFLKSKDILKQTDTSVTSANDTIEEDENQIWQSILKEMEAEPQLNKVEEVTSTPPTKDIPKSTKLKEQSQKPQVSGYL